MGFAQKICSEMKTMLLYLPAYLCMGDTKEKLATYRPRIYQEPRRFNDLSLLHPYGITSFGASHLAQELRGWTSKPNNRIITSPSDWEIIYDFNQQERTEIQGIQQRAIDAQIAWGTTLHSLSSQLRGALNGLPDEIHDIGQEIDKSNLDELEVPFEGETSLTSFKGKFKGELLGLIQPTDWGEEDRVYAAIFLKEMEVEQSEEFRADDYFGLIHNTITTILCVPLYGLSEQDGRGTAWKKLTSENEKALAVLQYSHEAGRDYTTCIESQDFEYPVKEKGQPVRRSSFIQIGKREGKEFMTSLRWGYHVGLALTCKEEMGELNFIEFQPDGESKINLLEDDYFGTRTSRNPSPPYELGRMSVETNLKYVLPKYCVGPLVTQFLEGLPVNHLWVRNPLRDES